MSQKSDSKGGPGLPDIGVVITLLIPLLYTSGWSFAYHYFDRFQLGMIGLDIPKEYLFQYSLWVIKDNLPTFSILIFTTVLAYFLIRLSLIQPKPNENPEDAEDENQDQDQDEETQKKFLFIQKETLIRFIGILSAPIFMLLLFSVFDHLGSETAEKKYNLQVKEDYPSYPRVKIWLTPKGKEAAGGMAEQWSKGCYRLLLTNKDKYYIFYADEFDSKTPTDIIPRTHVSSARALPVRKSGGDCN